MGYALLVHAWLPGQPWVREALYSLLPRALAMVALGPMLTTVQALLNPSSAVVQPANPCAAPSAGNRWIGPLMSLMAHLVFGGRRPDPLAEARLILRIPFDAVATLRENGWVYMFITAESGRHRRAGMPAELVAALKRKEPTAFEQLIAQHGTMLYQVALRLMSQPEEAEDVLQETLLTVYQKIHTFDERSALTTWLYRIVVNTALMRLRAKARAAEELLDPVGPPFTEEGAHVREVAEWAIPPEESLLRQEATAVLHEGMARLPERYRAVYVLAEIEGLPHQEIATILDLAVGTVKIRLHRARLFLREALADYFAERRHTSA
jgi:RNA polymerase sigma-70 factor (ECF subfamily)